MTAAEHDVVYVDLIEDDPKSLAEFGEDAAEPYDDVHELDAAYRNYLARFQPFRWHSTSEGNHRVLGLGERYFNEADAEANIRLQFSGDTIVYLRRAEHGDEVLRMPPPISLLDATETFMEKARQLEAVGFSNTSAADDVRVLRQNLLAEEYREYSAAEWVDDLTEVVDGLLDVIVVAWGTLLAYVGPDKAKAAAAEVARSNLDKVIGDGLPLFREDGKVLKPEGWTAPNIAGAIA